MSVEALSTPVAPPIQTPNTQDLPTEDGIPMESPIHRAQMNLLIELTDVYWFDRTDYYVGGNMFVYFSQQQIRNQDYRGPDFYIVTEVDGTKEREAWVVWEENGRYPNLIIELLSPTTAETDKTVKKQLYERTFHTLEYFCYDPVTHELLGWRLESGSYRPIVPDKAGRMWSVTLQLWLGIGEGTYLKFTRPWLRFFDDHGQMTPTMAEQEAARAQQEAARAQQEAARAQREATRAEQEAARAEQEATRAEQEATRAEQATARAQQEATRADEAEAKAANLEAELARLRQQLKVAGPKTEED